MRVIAVAMLLYSFFMGVLLKATKAIIPNVPAEAAVPSIISPNVVIAVIIGIVALIVLLMLVFLLISTIIKNKDINDGW